MCLMWLYVICLGLVVIVFNFFFFKQKTAYEMRISDWSSDVCSSDLLRRRAGRDYGCAAGPDDHAGAAGSRQPAVLGRRRRGPALHRHRLSARGAAAQCAARALRRRGTCAPGDRKSVGEGKSVSVRVDLGGGRTIKKKHKRRYPTIP